MKKHKKAIIWTVSILAVLAVLAVTSPFWLTAIGMRMTKYPGRYAASVDSYGEIAREAGERDIFIPDLTDLGKLTEEEVHVGYRMVMDSQFSWAKPDHCEVYINLGDPKAPTQFFFNRCREEPTAEGEHREYRGVAWDAYYMENHIKLGGTCYRVGGGAGTADAAFLDALTELIIDQYLARA